MKMYTGKQRATRFLAVVIFAFVYSGAGYFYVLYCKDSPLPFMMLAVILFVPLWKWATGFTALKDAFLVNKNNRVLSYHEDNLFIRTSMLKKTGTRVVRCDLQDVVIDGTFRVLAGGEGKFVQIETAVWASVDMCRLQQYLNTFFPRNYQSYSPEARLKKLVEKFFEEQKWRQYKESNANSVANIVGRKLAEYLKEQLPLIGLRAHLISTMITEE